jgi:hypothetical protein
MKIITEYQEHCKTRAIVGDMWLLQQGINSFNKKSDNPWSRAFWAETVLERLREIRKHDEMCYQTVVLYYRQELQEAVKVYRESKKTES